MDIDDGTWPDIRRQYAEIIEHVCRRAVDLEVPGLLVFALDVPAFLPAEYGLA